jgi:hypothetical protein
MVLRIYNRAAENSAASRFPFFDKIIEYAIIATFIIKCVASFREYGIRFILGKCRNTVCINKISRITKISKIKGRKNNLI